MSAAVKSPSELHVERATAIVRDLPDEAAVQAVLDVCRARLSELRKRARAQALAEAFAGFAAHGVGGVVERGPQSYVDMVTAKITTRAAARFVIRYVKRGRKWTGVFVSPADRPERKAWRWVDVVALGSGSWKAVGPAGGVR